MALGQREDGEAFRDVLLQPLCEFRGAFGVGLNDASEFGLGGGEIGGVPDGPQLAADRLAHEDSFLEVTLRLFSTDDIAGADFLLQHLAALEAVGLLSTHPDRSIMGLIQLAI